MMACLEARGTSAGYHRHWRAQEPACRDCPRAHSAEAGLAGDERLPKDRYQLPALARVVTEQAWMADAACRGTDPDLWVPERGEATKAALDICWNECPVREQCLDYGMSLGAKEPGIYGGLSGRDRRRARRKNLDPVSVKPLPRNPNLVRTRPAACGTPSGYTRHLRLNEVACGPCRDAKRQADIAYLRTGTSTTRRTR